MIKVDQEILKKTLAALNKTKELICFAIQFTGAVEKDVIRPNQFGKKVLVREEGIENPFHINLDWEQQPDHFKEVVRDIQSCIINYAIILCRESYDRNLWVTEEQNSDLYAAQMILKLVRDAVAHIKADTTKHAVPFWDIRNKNDRKKYEIKELGIVLDATDLNDKPFRFMHLGGVQNLVKILNYLIKDLQTQLFAVDKQQTLDNKPEKFSERGL